MLKLHHRSNICALLGLKQRHLLEAKDACYEVCGEATDRDIEASHPLVVLVTLGRDAVLCALKLCLQLKEILTRLEVGVTLRDGDEASQCLAYLVLCLHPRCHLLGSR